VLIEPSGVADIASLIGVMQRPALQPLLKGLNITTVIDAGAFLADYASLPAHFAAQARLASTLVINKADLVSPAEKMAVAETLRRLNPVVKIVQARYGHVEGEITAAPRIALVHENHESHDCTGHDCDHHDHHHDAHDHAHEHAHDHAAHDLGFTSWNTELVNHCDADALQAVLEDIVRGHFGDIARVKGLAKSGAGWLHFDVAGGRASMTAFAAGADEQPRVVAIGRDIHTDDLTTAFLACDIKLAA
jgi:G3E family GTPase